jgi:hypothetical protein
MRLGVVLPWAARETRDASLPRAKRTSEGQIDQLLIVAGIETSPFRMEIHGLACPVQRRRLQRHPRLVEHSYATVGHRSKRTGYPILLL